MRGRPETAPPSAKTFRLLRIAEQTGLFGFNQVGHTADVGGQHRHSGRHRLKHHHRAVVLVGRQRYHRGRPEIIPDPFASGKRDVFAPRPLPDQLLEFFAVAIVFRLAKKHEPDFILPSERIKRANEIILVLPAADHSHAKDHRWCRQIWRSLHVEKARVHRVGQLPSLPRQVFDGRAGVVSDAHHPVCARQDESFQPSGQPVVGQDPLPVQRRDEPHIAMKRQHIGIPRKNRADAAVHFCALAVDDVRPDLPDFFPRRAGATLEQRAHPADFGDDQAVKKRVRRNFFRRTHRLADAGNHMDLNVRDHCQPFQQRGGRGAKVRLRVRIVFVRLPVVRGQNDDAHGCFSIIVINSTRPQKLLEIFHQPAAPKAPAPVGTFKSRWR